MRVTWRLDWLLLLLLLLLQPQLLPLPLRQPRPLK